MDVLTQFHHLKMAIRIQRSRLYGPTEPRESSTGLHDMQVNLNEYVLFNEIVGATKNLFSGIDPEDWVCFVNRKTFWSSILTQVAE